MKRSHTILLALLFFSGGYLYAFPSTTVPYALGVLLHLAAGVVLAAVLVRELLRLLRQNSFPMRFGWGMLAVGAALGVALVFTGSLRVRLVGTQSNHNGLGAVVRVGAGREQQWRMLRSGSSYLSQSELVLTFGLGSQAKADTVEVRWPSGRVDRLTDVAAGQVITVKEGEGLLSAQPFRKK